MDVQVILSLTHIISFWNRISDAIDMENCTVTIWVCQGQGMSGRQMHQLPSRSIYTSTKLVNVPSWRSIGVVVVRPMPGWRLRLAGQMGRVCKKR